MENKVDLKSLWSSQPVPRADQAAIFKKIDKYKRSGLVKTLFLNACLALTIVAVILIWIYFQPRFLTTKLGIILVVLAMIMVMVFNAKIIPLYKRGDDSRSNLDYLNIMLKIKTRTHFIQTRIMSIYFLILSAGMALYLYEYTVRMKPLWAITAYSIVFIWIGFNWFVLRPRIIKKNTAKMEALVAELKALKEQFTSSTLP